MWKLWTISKISQRINFKGVLSRSQCTITGNFSLPDTIFEERKLALIKKVEQFSVNQPIIKDISGAAVLIPFCIIDGKPSVLLTNRSHKIVRNKGDVSFPGGKVDRNDENVLMTALRETTEEIGVLETNVDVWVAMRPMPTRTSEDSSMKVVPVIGFVHNLILSQLTIDQNEVASVFTASLEELCNPVNQGYTKFKNGSVLPLFYKKPYKIWGFTAAVLDIVLGLLLPELYSVKFRKARQRKRAKIK